MDELKIPDDLKETFDRAHARTVIASDVAILLIQRIARLEAPVSDDEWDHIGYHYHRQQVTGREGVDRLIKARIVGQW